MEWIKPGTKIDFIGRQKITVIISSILVLGSLASMLFKGCNYGVDFAGGTDIQVYFGDPAKSPIRSENDIRSVLRTGTYAKSEVASFGDKPNTFLIRVQQVSFLSDSEEAKLKDALWDKLGEPFYATKNGYVQKGKQIEVRLVEKLDEKKSKRLKELLDGVSDFPFSGIKPLAGTDKGFVIELKKEKFPPSALWKAKWKLRNELGKRLYRKEGGFDLEGDRLEISFLKKVAGAEVEKIFKELKLKLRESVELVDSKTNKYLIRLLTSQETKAITVGLNKALKEAFGKDLRTKELQFKHYRAYLTFKNKVDIAKITEAFNKAGVPLRSGVELLKKERNEFTVHLVGLAAKVQEDLLKAFPKNAIHVERVDSVGPKIGAKLRNDGIASIFYALLFILIYIAFRFDFRFAPGAVLALAHDVIITVGVFSITGKEFTLPIIAALLTIIGYSLNDTIVVYDRIRENFGKLRERKLSELVNHSINETLSRTILTSLTTFFVVLAIYLLGGGIIRDFAFALLIGVIIGTYSSIFVASPTVILLDKYIGKARK